MKTFSIFFSVCSMLLLLLFACEEIEHNPLVTDEGVPLPVTAPVVENLPGAAKISYQIPVTEGLLYVKAVYEIGGLKKEVKSSYYASSLLVEGFGDTNEYDVKLYSVGRNEKMSPPVSVTIKPLTPPIQDVYNSINVIEDWGGISFSFLNDAEASIVIEVLTKDSLGNWVLAETFYTKMKSGDFAVRGYEPVKRMFGITIHDRWNNRTDTLANEYTPMYEVELDKTKFRKVDLPTDYNVGYVGNYLENIWNNSLVLPDYVSTPGKGLPQWFTFDMGVTAKLSRIKVYGRITAQYIYNSGATKLWELYGSTAPNPDGSWDSSWTFLRSCQSIKPSGLPKGQYNNEDVERMKNGEEFPFDKILPPVRYIRWKTLQNWGDVTHANIAEITIYGQVVN